MKVFASLAAESCIFSLYLFIKFLFAKCNDKSLYDFNFWPFWDLLIWARAFVFSLYANSVQTMYYTILSLKKLSWFFLVFFDIQVSLCYFCSCYSTRITDDKWLGLTGHLYLSVPNPTVAGTPSAECPESCPGDFWRSISKERTSNPPGSQWE